MNHKMKGLFNIGITLTVSPREEWWTYRQKPTKVRCTYREAKLSGNRNRHQRKPVRLNKWCNRKKNVFCISQKIHIQYATSIYMFIQF